jgi:hypothetical protein
MSPTPRVSTLTGGKNAILTDPLFQASDTGCPSGLTGYGRWLNGAAYWNLTGFTVLGGIERASSSTPRRT